jgi:DNA primase large subunit
MWVQFKESIAFNVKPGSKNFPEAKEFIKVPFKDALSLVNNRQVFLHRGIAYVHIVDLNSIARA